VRRLVDRLRPHTLQARFALGILIVLVVSIVVIQGVILGIVNGRAQREVERSLSAQVQEVATFIARGGPSRVGPNASLAGNLLPDTSLRVSVDGVNVAWNRVSAPSYTAEVSATRGNVVVTLAKVDPVSTIDSWRLIALLSAGLIGIALTVWLVARSLGQRLRRSLRALSQTAERVAGGDLSVRTPVSDDEVGRLGQAFNGMTARLEAADARQREFLADELRTPVTAIEGFAAALEDGTARSDEDRTEAAEFIRLEAARLRELVRDLQELTWLDLDPPLRIELSDLSELCREAVARQAAYADDRSVALDVVGEPVTVATDPAHVTTILANLVSNALKATSSGGAVTLMTGRRGSDAYIEVTDTGVGIPAEHIPYLFDRLFRIDSARSRSGEAGSGLGLSIVNRLAILLGGRVTVASTVGSGTTFTVFLPAMAPARPRIATTMAVSE
jgi:signal transduction histidine kinase